MKLTPSQQTAFEQAKSAQVLLGMVLRDVKREPSESNLRNLERASKAVSDHVATLVKL